VRHGCTEQHEHAVAEDLVHAATELDDHLDQALEARVDEALHLLGVHVLGERGETDQVREQHRDDPPLFRLGLHRRHLVTARRAESSARGDVGSAGCTQHHPASVGDIRPHTDAVSSSEDERAGAALTDVTRKGGAQRVRFGLQRCP
jgi:hypothetical protein